MGPLTSKQTMSEKGGKTISKPLYPKIPVLSEATFQKSWLGPIRTPNVPECSDGPAVRSNSVGKKSPNNFLKRRPQHLSIGWKNNFAQNEKNDFAQNEHT